MRYSALISAMVMSIALYFSLFWGFDALRILTSPNYGLEDMWRSQAVYWIARWLALGPQAMINLAAILGTIKLAAAGIFAVHVFDRIRAFKRKRVDHDVLELGLLLVVGLSIVTVAPAIWQNDATLVRTATLNLVLASLAVALGAFERSDSPKSPANKLAAHANTDWYSPWR